MGPDKLFTVGHSTRSLDEFLELLKREGVRHLVDVRAFPASRRYPHFSRENLGPSLAASGLGYTHFPELGGRRKPRPDSRNVQWRNEGFRAYADYMATSEFAAAIDRLLVLAEQETSAVMCAEAVPWRCHRNLIADAVAARGVQVFHVLDAATSRHTITSFARVEGSRVRYDSPTQPELFEK